MNKQFTASEVRAAIAGFSGYSVTHHGIGGNLIAMLNAFADLLKAREKAVPVMVVNSVSSAEHDLPIGMKLYTHPSPSDADRLAEALRRTCRKMKTFSRTGALDGAVAVWVDEIESVLAAHSTQAQPSVQSKYAPPYPDQAQDPFWKVPEMVDTRPKAQPPAASVTDGLVNALRHQRQIDEDGAEVGVSRQAVDEAIAILTMLAAQENPNG